MNPYQNFVSDFVRLVAEGKNLPLGGFPPRGHSAPPFNAPVALIFSPHPDDECIIGGLALRLLRQAKWRVINVAVTLGSNTERRQFRLAELKNACDWLGFELEMTAPNGLEKIRPETRANDSARWNDATKVIVELLAKHSPRVIFFPHEHDGNSAHVGTHFLIMDALKTLPENFQCALVETEFWASMASPNLMVESSVNDAADLIAALSFHVGEVKRNPYHLRLPAWMQDNVRRGAERVGGQGGVAPDFQLATLYKARQWKKGRAKNLFDGGRQVGIKDNPAEIFAK